MPNFNARLAWAAPFHASKLGAHLEAFVSAMPQIDMLRLCNRRGKGKHAHVTKLPVELVDRIADLVMEHHRTDKYKIWSTNYQCWLDDCEPTDHLSETEIKSLWYEMRGQYKKVRAAARHGDPKLATLRDPDVEDIFEVDDFLRASYKEDLDMLKSATDFDLRHESAQKEWHERVGFPGRPCRGYLGHTRTTFIRYFGLEVWSAHTRRECQRGCEHNGTLTYLTLPIPQENKPHIRWCHEFDEDEGDFKTTETSFPIHVAFPHKPRKTQLAAFPRAMKMLGLSIDDLTGTEAEIGALEEDLNQENEPSLWVDKHGVEHSSEWPKLMLLATHS